MLLKYTLFVRFDFLTSIISYKKRRIKTFCFCEIFKRNNFTTKANFNDLMI